MPNRPELQPSHQLDRQLRPLAALLLTVVTSVAPLVWFAVHLHEATSDGERVARQVATLLQREVVTQPELWRYDTQKFADQLEILRINGGLAAVAVRDDQGLVLAVPNAQAASGDVPARLWCRSPLMAPTRGEVLAVVDLRPLWRTTAWIALFFLAVALTLAGLLMTLPLRAVRRAEAQIHKLVGQLQQSQGQLQQLATSLEERVADRSQQLEQALADLRMQQGQLRALSGQALRLQESERRDIARDLHDGIGQALTAVRLQVQVLAASVPPSARETVTLLLQLLDDAMDETRRAVQRLAPPLLAEQGLAGALRQTCVTLAGRGAVTVDLTYALAQPLDSAVELACFRIVQEALSNAVRHGRATHIGVTVQLATTDSQPGLEINICDDGAGFDAADVLMKTRTSGGNGLTNMRQRAQLLGGRLDITAAQQAGCQVRAWLPIDSGGSTGAA